MNNCQEDSENKSKSPAQSLFDASIFLAFFSAYTYFCTYEYELGYCRAFEIPEYLVEPTTTTLLQFASVLFLTITISLTPVGLLIPALKRNYSNFIIGRIVKINVFCLIVLIIAFINLKFNLTAALLGLVAVLWVNFSSWGLPYLFSLKAKDPIEKAYQLSRDSKDFNPFGLLEDFVDKRYHLHIISVILLPLLLNLYGSGKAFVKNEFEYLKGHSDLIVVKKYGDQLVLKQINRQNKTILHGTTLLKIDHTINLITTKIDSLKIGN